MGGALNEPEGNALRIARETAALNLATLTSNQGKLLKTYHGSKQAPRNPTCFAWRLVDCCDGTNVAKSMKERCTETQAQFKSFPVSVDKRELIMPVAQYPVGAQTNTHPVARSTQPPTTRAIFPDPSDIQVVIESQVNALCPANKAAGVATDVVAQAPLFFAWPQGMSPQSKGSEASPTSTAVEFQAVPETEIPPLDPVMRQESAFIPRVSQTPLISMGLPDQWLSEYQHQLCHKSSSSLQTFLPASCQDEVVMDDESIYQEDSNMSVAPSVVDVVPQESTTPDRSVHRGDGDDAHTPMDTSPKKGTSKVPADLISKYATMADACQEAASRARSSITKAALQELQSFSRPPAAVLKTMQMILRILFGRKMSDWRDIRRTIRGTEFMRQLMCFDVNGFSVLKAKRLQDEYLKPNCSGSLNYAHVNACSIACACCFVWCENMLKVCVLSHKLDALKCTVGAYSPCNSPQVTPTKPSASGALCTPQTVLDCAEIVDDLSMDKQQGQLEEEEEPHECMEASLDCVEGMDDSSHAQDMTSDPAPCAPALTSSLLHTPLVNAQTPTCYLSEMKAKFVPWSPSHNQLRGPSYRGDRAADLVHGVVMSSPTSIATVASASDVDCTSPHRSVLSGHCADQIAVTSEEGCVGEEGVEALMSFPPSPAISLASSADGRMMKETFRLASPTTGSSSTSVLQKLFGRCTASTFDAPSPTPHCTRKLQKKHARPHTAKKIVDYSGLVSSHNPITVNTRYPESSDKQTKRWLSESRKSFGASHESHNSSSGSTMSRCTRMSSRY